MIRVGDPSLPVEEGEERALIDAAEPRHSVDSRAEQIGHAFTEIIELGVSTIGERQDGDGSRLGRQVCCSGTSDDHSEKGDGAKNQEYDDAGDDPPATRAFGAG